MALPLKEKYEIERRKEEQSLEENLFVSYKSGMKTILINRLLIWFTLLALVVWSWIGTSFQLMDIVYGFTNITEFIYQDFLPPDFQSIGQFISPALDTLYMSYTGMVMSVIFSIFFGLMAARNLSFHPIIAFLSRAVIAFVRSVPAIVWGILLVVGIGLGPMAGTIALGLSGVGILGKAFADILEEIDEKQIEAIRSTGAGWFAIIGQAVWPQFKSSFVTWSLYKMDLNIREAAILGVVGAGGIGYALEGRISLFQYEQAATGILIIFLMIVCVEYVTAKIREKII